MPGEIPRGDNEKYGAVSVDTGRTHEAFEKGERRSFDIRNAKGEVICQVEGVFSLVEEPEVLEGLRVFASKNGGDNQTAFFSVQDVSVVSPNKTALIPLFGVCPIPEGKIYVPAKRLKNYCHAKGGDDEESIVIVPPPETAIDIGVWFHEFGHTAQMQEEMYQEIEKGEKERKALMPPYTQNKLAEILRLLKEIPGAFSSGLLLASDQEQMEGLLERQRLVNMQAVELREAFSALEERKNLAHWDFLLQYMENGKMFGVVPESISSYEGIPDERGNTMWELSWDELDEEDRRETANALGERLGEFAKRVMAGEAISEDTAKVRIHWSENKPIASISFTDIATRTTANVYLSSSADREAFDVLEQTLATIQTEGAVLQQTKGVTLVQYDEAVRNEVGSFLRAQESVIRETFLRPRRLLEQDATRRALTWIMRLYREHGINLIQDLVVEDVADGLSTDRTFRTNAEGREVTSIREDMRAALQTYGADYTQMKPERPTKNLPQ